MLKIKTTAKPVGLGRRLRLEKLSKRLDVLDDLAEYVTDCRTKDRQNDDNNDGN
jgi:hypothetical protein